MPTVPWTPTAPVHAGADYLIMATRFTVARRRDMLRVIAASNGLWSGIARTEGLVGYSISSRPARGTLATVSAWRDRDAMLAFVRGGAHQKLVQQTRELMRESAFASWGAHGAALPPDWASAEQQLDAGLSAARSGRIPYEHATMLLAGPRAGMRAGRG
jgi:quinol monooxygenase YgiN